MPNYVLMYSILKLDSWAIVSEQNFYSETIFCCMHSDVSHFEGESEITIFFASEQFQLKLV